MQSRAQLGGELKAQVWACELHLESMGRNMYNISRQGAQAASASAQSDARAKESNSKNDRLEQQLQTALQDIGAWVDR